MTPRTTTRAACSMRSPTRSEVSLGRTVRTSRRGGPGGSPGPPRRGCRAGRTAYAIGRRGGRPGVLRPACEAARRRAQLSPEEGARVSTEHDDARPVTIYTVAERAGVSIATVSRVLSGSTPASAMTRQRVLRAVEDLEYVPLRAGRTVDVPSHETHGLVLPGLRGPYYSEPALGLRVDGRPRGAVGRRRRVRRVQGRRGLGAQDPRPCRRHRHRQRHGQRHDGAPDRALHPDGARRARRHRGL